MFFNFKFLFVWLQFLLTPPDEGPRVKGQRIKLQDIIEGMYNPLSSNNGCWISCKCCHLGISLSRHCYHLNILFTYSWWVFVSESMGRNRIIDRWKPVREDIDVEYNIRESELYLHFKEKMFSIAPFLLRKTAKSVFVVT